MMIKNEHTSEQIATYASELLKMDKPLGISQELWGKIQSVAGSALTQSPDNIKQGPSLAKLYANLAVKTKAEKDKTAKENVAFLNSYYAKQW